MEFEAWVICIADGFFAQHGLPFLVRDQSLAAEIEYAMRPIGADVRKIAKVRVTLERLPELAWGVAKASGDKELPDGMP